MPHDKKQLIHCDISAGKTKEVVYAAVLKDQTKAYFYYLDNECRGCLEQGLGMLSPGSRRNRFNFSLKHFSPQELDYLTCIDNKNHVAIGCRQLRTNSYPGMGVGRYIRLPDKPDTAEIAITILDAYHNKGIGTLLYCLLADNALKNGIRHLAGYVRADNVPMTALMQKFGFVLKNQGHNLRYWENDVMDNEEKVRKLLAGHLV